MKLKEQKLSFYPAEKKHQEIILGWFKKKYVNEFFYGEGLERTIKDLDLFVNGINRNEEYTFEHWIAYIGDKPFGFLMTTLIEGPHSSEDGINKWYEEGKTTILIDLLIGEEKYLGKGLAARMIREFLLDKCSHVSKALIDPEVTNKKAIHVYEKAGFKKVEHFEPKYYPVPHWMMILDMDQLRA